jgi:hypothetical protein
MYIYTNVYVYENMYACMYVHVCVVCMYVCTTAIHFDYPSYGKFYAQWLVVSAIIPLCQWRTPWPYATIGSAERFTSRSTAPILGSRSNRSGRVQTGQVALQLEVTVTSCVLLLIGWLQESLPGDRNVGGEHLLHSAVKSYNTPTIFLQ